MTTTTFLSLNIGGRASFLQVRALPGAKAPPRPLIRAELHDGGSFLRRQVAIQHFVLMPLAWMHHKGNLAAGTRAMHRIELRGCMIDLDEAVGQSLDRARHSVEGYLCSHRMELIGNPSIGRDSVMN